jgi:hypothetical protein
MHYNIREDSGIYICCRFTSGIYNESYDEEVTHGVVLALCGGDTSGVVLSETLPSTTELPVERTLDSPHNTVEVPSC